MSRIQKVSLAIQNTFFLISALLRSFIIYRKITIIRQWDPYLYCWCFWLIDQRKLHSFFSVNCNRQNRLAKVYNVVFVLSLKSIFLSQENVLLYCINIFNETFIVFNTTYGGNTYFDQYLLQMYFKFQEMFLNWLNSRRAKRRRTIRWSGWRFRKNRIPATKIRKEAIGRESLTSFCRSSVMLLVSSTSKC